MPESRSTPITPLAGHVISARQELEPLYEKLQMQTKTKLLEVAIEAGWSPIEAAKAVAALKHHDALVTVGRDS
jgi:hypothetical protein